MVDGEVEQGWHNESRDQPVNQAPYINLTINQVNQAPYINLTIKQVNQAPYINLTIKQDLMVSFNHFF